MISYLVALLSNYLGLAITIAIQVFLLPFLLNNLGPKLTGLYYLFMTISNFVAVGIGWLSGAGVYLLASSDSQRKKISVLQDVHWVVFLGFSAYATLILLIIVLVGMTAGNWWLRGAEVSLINEGRNACFALGLYIWLHYIHQADISLFTALLQQGWANFYRIVSQVVFGAIVIFFIINNPRLDWLMAANLAGVMIAAIAAFIHNLIYGGKIRVVHTFHGHVFHGYFGRMMSTIFILTERILAKITEIIIAISESQKNELVNKYRIVRASKVRVVKLGFDLEPFVSSKDLARESTQICDLCG